MRASLDEFRSTDGGHRRQQPGRTAGAAALREPVPPALAPAPCLRLPRLDRAIPHAIKPVKFATTDARVAHFLIAAGAIREADIPPVWEDAIEVCQGALDAWGKRELGPLHCLTPTFCLTPVGNEAMQDKNGTPYESVSLCWFENNEQQWIVGPGLEALEAAHPGLGQTVFAILSRKSFLVYPLYSPGEAADTASYVYWMGEASEDAVLDMECGDDPDAREAMRAEMVTAQEIRDAFPPWVLATPSRRLADATLKELSARLPDPELREIIADTRALARLSLTRAFRPDFEGEYLGWGAVLSWREDDLTVRIFDDMRRMAFEGEYCELIGEVELALNEPQTMRAWQRAMRVRFKAIRLIDRLIYRLSARDWS